MPGAIQVELLVDADGTCPVATASAERPVSGAIAWNAPVDGEIVEEFAVEGELDRPPAGVEPIFETESRTRYRFARESGTVTCPCEAVEAAGYPVTDVRPRDGSLALTFYVDDVASVRALVETLRERFANVRLTNLRRSGESAGQDLVRVDRGRLTDRQREVLETAFEMGYFERPRDANATEVAAELDISVATFAEHVAVAQSKLLESLLESA